MSWLFFIHGRQPFAWRWNMKSLIKHGCQTYISVISLERTWADHPTWELTPGPDQTGINDQRFHRSHLSIFIFGIPLLITGWHLFFQKKFLVYRSDKKLKETLFGSPSIPSLWQKDIPRWWEGRYLTGRFRRRSSWVTISAFEKMIWEKKWFWKYLIGTVMIMASIHISSDRRVTPDLVLCFLRPEGCWNYSEMKNQPTSAVNIPILCLCWWSARRRMAKTVVQLSNDQAG